MFNHRMFYVSLIGFVLAWGAVAAACVAVTPSAQAATKCAEDDSCWVWSRMGDHKRGVVTLYGNRVNVGPCAFARLWDAGHIRYSVTLDGVRYPQTERLRGDAWARKHGCVGNVQNY